MSYCGIVLIKETYFHRVVTVYWNICVWINISNYATGILKRCWVGEALRYFGYIHVYVMWYTDDIVWEMCVSIITISPIRLPCPSGVTITHYMANARSLWMSKYAVMTEHWPNLTNWRPWGCRLRTYFVAPMRLHAYNIVPQLLILSVGDG